MMPGIFDCAAGLRASQMREPFSTPKFPQQATELRHLEQLPWPRNLFDEPASIAELMAEHHKHVMVGYRLELLGALTAVAKGSGRGMSS
jgi:hypothetical protein